MPRRRILRLFFPAACTACLALGFASAGRWVALYVVVLPFLAWLAAFKWRFEFLPSAALVFSIGVAAAGLFASVAPWMMMLAATLALAAWDVALLDRALTGDAPAFAGGLLERGHYRSLGLAVGLGLLTAVVGPMIRFQISFAGMMVLTIIALLCLEGLRLRIGR